MNENEQNHKKGCLSAQNKKNDVDVDVDDKQSLISFHFLIQFT